MDCIPINMLVKNHGPISSEEKKEIIKFEDKVGFLKSSSTKANFYRVTAYISNDDARKTLFAMLPQETAITLPIILSSTAGCAAIGAGIGGLASGGPGVVPGAIIGGVVGLGIGIHLSSKILKIDLHVNYNHWKKNTTNGYLITELKRVFKDEVIFADCRCGISDEIYECPVMLIPCGHTYDNKEIEGWAKKDAKMKFLDDSKTIPCPDCTPKETMHCPACRTHVKSIELDLIKLGYLKRIFLSLADANSANLNYNPDIRMAFKAMGQDFHKHIKTIYSESSAKLLLLFTEERITLSVFRRKQRELEEKFNDMLDESQIL